MAAVGFVHVQHCMSGCSGASERIENECVLIACDLQNALDQARRLWGIECGVAVENGFQYLGRFVRVAYITVLPHRFVGGLPPTESMYVFLRIPPLPPLVK